MIENPGIIDVLPPILRGYMDNSELNNFDELHRLLKESLRKEISALREILSNMNQEKELIISHDGENRKKILYHRTCLLNHLTSLHDQKIRVLKTLSSFQTNEPKILPLDKILKKDHVDCCETFFLHDQLTSLREKIDMQHQENKTLINQSKNNEIPSYLKKEKQVQKTTVTTQKRQKQGLN